MFINTCSQVTICQEDATKITMATASKSTGGCATNTKDSTDNSGDHSTATDTMQAIEKLGENKGVADTGTSKHENEGATAVEPSAETGESKELNYTLVDDEDSLSKTLVYIKEAVKKEPLIAFACEGVDLSRKGKLYLLSIATRTKAYLIDVKVLKTMPFEKGLREILEDTNVKKLMFDCREDSDALFHQFQVKLDGVLDMQLLEVMKAHSDEIGITIGRRSERHDEVVRVKGLMECIEVYIKNKTMLQTKRKGAGKLSDWEKRPLLKHELEYAKTDVFALFELYTKLKSDEEGMKRLETASRIYADMKRSMVNRTYDEYENNGFLPMGVIPQKGCTSLEPCSNTTQCTTCKRWFPRDEFSNTQLSNGVQKCRTCKKVKREEDEERNYRMHRPTRIFRNYDWDDEALTRESAGLAYLEIATRCIAQGRNPPTFDSDAVQDSGSLILYDEVLESYYFVDI